MYQHRRPSTASSTSSTQSHNSITRTMRNARERIQRHMSNSHNASTVTTDMHGRRGSTPDASATCVAPGYLDQRRRQSSTCSERSCSGISADEVSELWACMLELQGEYGCYNSTRMELAMDAGEDAGALMPSRFIIDTLNDSVFDLPEEGWEKLDRYLRHDAKDDK